MSRRITDFHITTWLAKGRHGARATETLAEQRRTRTTADNLLRRRSQTLVRAHPTQQTMNSTGGSTLHVSVWSATNGVRPPYGRPTCNSACYSPLAFFNVSNLDLRRVNVETRKHLQAGEAARAIGVKGAYEAVQSRSQLAPHAGRRYGGDAIRVKRRK